MAGRREWVLNGRKVPLSCENVDCRGPQTASSRSTFQVSNSTGFYPRIQVDTTNSGAVGQAGGVLLTETIAAAGLGPAMSAALSGWRKPLAVHDPAKVVLDLAVTMALGGDCLADIALLRSEPGLYGSVASDATVSRTITALAADAPAALAAIDTARAAGRARAWKVAGVHAPDHGASARTPLIVDLDATLVGSHSEKELAAPTYKRGFGFHPLWSFLDHGAAGTGEPLSVLLRPGNAGSNTATDHIAVIKDALAQLPSHRRRKRAGRKVLIRTGSAGVHPQGPDLDVGSAVVVLGRISVAPQHFRPVGADPGRRVDPGL